MGELRQRGNIWFIRYSRNGRRYEESSHSTKKGVAIDLLKAREGTGADGRVTPAIAKFRFDEAVEDLLNDYTTNGKKSVVDVAGKIDRHLRPYFGGRRLASIRTGDVRKYIVHRQASTEIVYRARTVTLPNGTTRQVPERRRAITGVANGEINRELAILKRIFTLAVQSEKLLHRPHVPMLREQNTRTGFFEPDQFERVMAHLPTELQGVIEFAYVTGWRIDSEVLPLEWRQVDFRGGEIRLDAGTTKNGQGRVFPMTDDLRRLLEEQHAQHVRLKKAGHIEPHVFIRLVAQGRGGDKVPRPIRKFQKVWQAACRAAGCPGRIPHDLRRTAVRAMVRRGIPERVAMQLTGHKTPSVFARYNIVSPGDLKTAAEQLRGLTTERRRTSGLT